MTTNLRVLFNPESRKTFNKTLLLLDGLGSVEEDFSIGYGAIALTGLGLNISDNNEELKGIIGNRQNMLKAAMAAAGITLYDPASSPYSPDLNLKALPQEVYMVDTGKLAQAGHVTFIDLIASTGCGIELEKARRFLKFLYHFHDPEVRTSRMQPDRTFHLSVRNFEESGPTLTDLFSFVNEHLPCAGQKGSEPVMLGMHRLKGNIVDLEKEIKDRWPELVYQYDGTKAVLPLSCLDLSALR